MSTLAALVAPLLAAAASAPPTAAELRWRALHRGRPGTTDPSGSPVGTGAAAPLPGTGAARSAPRRAGSWREQDATREAVVEFLRALASELRTGCPSGQALASAADVLLDAPPSGRLARELAPAATLGRAGHDPTPALRQAARIPGAEGLAHLAACWEASALSGAGLSDITERLADGLHEDLAHLRRLHADLAGPRTTAVLLAALPVLGLGMASSIAAEPVRFLFTTPAGWLCLVLGLALQGTGLLWTRRLIARVRGDLHHSEEPR